jgi:hypothetical protein
VNDRPDLEPADDSPEIVEVRRLLADARHAEPMPDDVAARLDGVLVDLSAQRSQPEEARPTEARPTSVVIPIAAHRRRRAAGMLVAAAAIVVGGVVATENIHLGSTSGSATSAEDNAQTDGGTAVGPVTEDGILPTPTTRPPGHTAPKTIVVRPRHFSADALKGQALLQRASLALGDNTAKSTCFASARQARAVPAEYQNAPAALVYRRPEGSSQVVELFVCGVSQPVRTATLPAP